MKRLSQLLFILTFTLATVHSHAQISVLAGPSNGINFDTAIGSQYILNNNGIVAFEATDNQAISRAIYAADGNGVITLAPSIFVGSSPSGTLFSFNNNNELLFASGDPTIGGSSLLTTTNGQTFGTYLSSTPSDGGMSSISSLQFQDTRNTYFIESFNANISSSITKFTPFSNGPITVQSGSTAQVLNNGVAQVVAGPGNTPFNNFRQFKVNSAGQVAAQFSANADTTTGIVRFNPDNSFTVLATNVSSDPAATNNRPPLAFNNSGEVAYLRTDPSLTMREIIITDGVSETVIASESNGIVNSGEKGYSMFSQPALSDAGVVFRAEVNDQTDPNFPDMYQALIMDRGNGLKELIRTGEVILGNKLVQSFFFDPEGLNDLGQIAVIANVEDLSTNNFANLLLMIDAAPLVLLAQDIPEPSSFALLALAGLACMRRRKTA